MDINICDQCGSKKSTYTGLWCPKYEKPEYEVKKSFNLIKVLKHVEAQGYPGLEDRMMDWFDDSGDLKGNDIYFDFQCLSPEDFLPDEHLQKDLEAIYKIMGWKFGEVYLMEVWW